MTVTSHFSNNAFHHNIEAVKTLIKYFRKVRYKKFRKLRKSCKRLWLHGFGDGLRPKRLKMNFFIYLSSPPKNLMSH